MSSYFSGQPQTQGGYPPAGQPSAQNTNPYQSLDMDQEQMDGRAPSGRMNLNFQMRYSETNSEPPFDYKNANIRLGFIRKVYYIITMMLLVTFGMVSITYFVPGFRAFQQSAVWLLIVATVLMIIIMYSLACYRCVARTVPWNYVLLSVFTLCMAYIVSYSTSLYKGSAILIAVGLTAAVVVALTVYAACTSTDFTTCIGLSIVLGIAMLVGSIIGLILRNQWFDVAMAILGCITFGFYLVIDTQLVIGKNSRGYSLDDYVMASVAIYLDIINLFLQILRIVGQAQRS